MPRLFLPVRPRRAILAAYAVLSVFAGAACDDATGPAAARDLRDAKRVWALRRPSAYTMTVQMICFCTPEVTSPVVVTVSGDSVQSRRYADTGAAVDPRIANVFPAVEGLFAIIEAAAARDPAQLDAEYDPALGYPTRVAIDYEAGVADDEHFYTVSDFQAR